MVLSPSACCVKLCKMLYTKQIQRNQNSGLFSAWIIIFPIAGSMSCLGFRMGIILIMHWCFWDWWAGLTKSQGLSWSHQKNVYHFFVCFNIFTCYYSFFLFCLIKRSFNPQILLFFQLHLGSGVLREHLWGV